MSAKSGLLKGMSEYPSRKPFIFGCVLFGTLRVSAIWLPMPAALALGVLAARIVDYFLFSKDEGSFADWLLKTVMLVALATASDVAFRDVLSRYTN